MVEEEASSNDGSSPHHNLLFDDTGPLADSLERRAVFAALDSFHQYRKNTHYNTTHRRRQNLYALPSAQWQMLAAPPISILDTLSAVDDAIDYNGDVADTIFQLGLASFGLSEEPPASSSSSRPSTDNPEREWDWRGKAKANDISKAQSTIRQFYRDWSAEGYALEVKPLLDTILSDLSKYLPKVELTKEPPSLLLPGAGLGRILFELCFHGYNATGNEISYHQLLASNFILNCTQHADQYPIYPFAHTFTNIVTRTNQLRRHTIPDVHPGTALSSRLEAGEPVGEMNMAAGDFVLSYSTPECKGIFDGVVSVFFIDTAPNLIRYIDTVRNCLRQDGVWINIGPLLWHFDDRAPGRGSNDDDEDEDDDDDEENIHNADDDKRHRHSPSSTPSHDHSSRSHSHSYSHKHKAALASEDQGIAEPGSFELSDDEVLALVTQQGFEIIHHEILDENNRHHPTTASGLGYMQDPTSLLQNRYRCSHWVARKL